MKFILSVILLTVALTAHADYRVSPPSYNYNTEQNTINSLKRYIKQAKEIIKKYEIVLNQYENTLIGFNRLRQTCTNFNPNSFTNAQRWAGCNRNASKLSNKLRQIALRLDKLETRIVRAKQHIKNATGILSGIDQKKKLVNQADDIIKELDRVERRNEALDRQAGL